MYLHQILIITSPIEFNITLTYVDARLKQRCINVVTTLCNVASTLCNVVSTLSQHQALTLYQRCAMLKIRRRILFHFQHYFNVDHKVETTFDRTLKCWLGKIKTDPITGSFIAILVKVWYFTKKYCNLKLKTYSVTNLVTDSFTAINKKALKLYLKQISS